VTMNVDGLHRSLPALQAVTLEMHGCARDTVCERCARTAPLAAPQLRAFRAAAARGAPAPRCTLPDAAAGGSSAASACGGAVRPRVMLYADPAETLITPPFDAALAADLAAADAVLWVGISFEQSASVEHFRRARRALQAAGLAATVPQLVVNPAAEAAFNVATAVANAGELRLLHARATADEFLARLAQLPPPAAKAQRKRRRGARADTP
jgi:NAD-dependent SIR2 family protein deacetylase